MKLTSDPAVTRTATEKNFYWLAKGVAIAAAVIALCTAILLAVSWKTSRDTAPAATETIESLVHHIESAPSDTALRNNLRSLDRLARGAYFASKDFQKKAGLILLVAGIALAIALRMMTAYGKNIPTPLEPEVRDTRLWATVVLGIFFVALVVAGYWFSTSSSIKDEVRSMNEQPLQTGVSPAPAAVPSSLIPHLSSLPTWSAFRGALGSGVADARKVPTAWADSDIAWATDIPLPGYNSPILWNNKIFLSGASATERKVFAFDTASGKLLWATNIASAGSTETPKVTDDTGFAASTMACDDKFVYAIFANGDLAALDHDGKLVWCKNLGISEISYGYASSLQTADGIVFVQRDIGKDNAIFAFSAVDGKVLWRVAHGDSCSWTSPVLARSGDKLLLIVTSPGQVDAYEAKNGILAWSAEGPTGEVAPSPAVSDKAVLVAMDYAGVTALSLADGSLLWKKDQLDAPEICSPLIIGERGYIPTDIGVLTCVNMADGETLWTHEFRDGFHASPVALGDAIYFTDTRGKVFVARDNATAYEEIAQSSLGEKTSATPAFSFDSLYFRSDKNKLLRVGNP